MKKAKLAEKKTPKLIQSSLGLFSEMDKDVFGSVHDEVMCWTDKHAQEIIDKLWPNIGKIFSREWEKPVSTNVKREDRLVGFIDLAVSISSEEVDYIYFEIKTQVRPGSDIRQIKAYKFYLSPLTTEYGERFRGRFVVVSPDDRHAELLTNQGIKFVKYPDFLGAKL